METKQEPGGEKKKPGRQTVSEERHLVYGHIAYINRD